jgi:hypothetical protein
MGDPQVSVTLFSLPFLEGDSIVLCSDGLTDLVQPAEIAEVVQSQSASDATQTLIDMANRRGGHDNISTIVVRNGPPQTSVAIAPRNKQSPNMLIGIGIVLIIALLIALIVIVLRVLPTSPSGNTTTTAPNAIQTVPVGGNAGRNNPIPGQPTATLSSAPIPTATQIALPTATQSSRPTQAVQIKPTTAVGSTVEPVAPAITSVVAVTPEPPVEPTAIPDLRPMVPNLINMPQDEAVAKLDALDIGHDVIDVTSSNYQADIGSVAETDPAAGTRLNPGDVVILKVKKNKPQSDTPPAAPAEPAAPPPPPKP